MRCMVLRRKDGSSGAKTKTDSRRRGKTQTERIRKVRTSCPAGNVFRSGTEMAAEASERCLDCGMCVGEGGPDMALGAVGEQAAV